MSSFLASYGINTGQPSGELQQTELSPEILEGIQKGQ